MSERFESLCEELWRQWLLGTVAFSPRLQTMFQTDYAPEPYLHFDDPSRPLIILTTNPGDGLAIQHRDAILKGNSVVQASDTYSHAAAILGGFYAQHLSGQAQRRIRSLRHLASLAGYSGILQVESCPFHSKSLPNKHELLSLFSHDMLLNSYVQALKEYLANRDVLIMSAIASNQNLASGDVRLSPWLAWQAELIGLHIDRAMMHPIVRKGVKVTATLITDRSAGVSKNMFLMMGGNHLPSDNGLRLIAEALKKP